jgi:membrane peptidoglycan carboxypeptidase
MLSKRKILEYYLNVVEWGPNIYGAEAAAYFYFGKSATQLDLAESSLLAAILPNPIYYNPFKNLKGARRKQNRVLKLMKDAHLISDAELNGIMNNPIYLRGTKQDLKNFVFELDSTSFDSLLKNPLLPDEIKKEVDSTGIIYLPPEE